jgi:hypothetical protein
MFLRVQQATALLSEDPTIPPEEVQPHPALEQLAKVLHHWPALGNDIGRGSYFPARLLLGIRLAG